MGLETWTAFALASVALLLIPGPTILLVIGQSLGAGSRGTVTRPAVRRRLNRVGGAMLVGAGLATATMRRA